MISIEPTMMLLLGVIVIAANDGARAAPHAHVALVAQDGVGLVHRMQVDAQGAVPAARGYTTRNS